MARTMFDLLEGAMEELGEDQFKKFKNKLSDRGQEYSLPKGAVEKKDEGEIARLLIDRFTEKGALKFSLQILGIIKAVQTAEDLEKEAAANGFSADAGSGSPATQVPEPSLPLDQISISQPGGLPAPVLVQSDYSEGSQKSLSVSSDLPDTSGMLILSSPQSKQKIISENGSEIYQILDKGARKRLALIINNIEFDIKSHNRDGAQRDEENMEKLLRGLGYDVIKHRNLSGKEMDKAVKDFAERKEHAQSDSTFVVLMSHGMRDKVLGIHHGKKNPDDFLPVDNIYTHLNTENCPALFNKPKVILIQACRGGKAGGIWMSDSEAVEECESEGDYKLKHNEKDFLSLLSCTPDNKAYRHPENGALFIGFLVQVFNKNAHKDHVEELFRQVMRRFEEFGSNDIKQMVCKERSNMPRLFYLFPGL